ncbi:NACHT domain-containing protein [Micromonospora chersina]|uniref:NACHT domain-containing protein n=1 Tax=Micromonospora chersina TaxID=47854 RepID=UPI0037169903
MKAAAAAASVVGRELAITAKGKISASDAGHIRFGLGSLRFIESLKPAQLESFKEFLESPQFEMLVHQAMISTFADRRQKDDSVLRDQVRHGLRHRGTLTGADLLQATDVCVELIHTSVQKVRRGAGAGSLDSGRAITMAALSASAAARNSELLDRIESVAEIEKFAVAMRAAMRANTSKLRLAHSVRNLRVGYGQLYISPTLSRADMLVGIRGDNVRAANVPADTEPEQEGVTLTQLLNESTRQVVLGDPGAGKSTLTLKLVHDLATDKMSGLEGQVPILLVVRSHTQSLRNDHQTLLHYLEASCRRPYNLTPPPDALEYLLLNGRATVIVDGVDELGDSAYREAFAQLVDGFARKYPLARMIVTSRVVGYTEAPLDPELFPVADMRPFDDRQVHSYASKWFKLDSSMGKGEQRALTESFISESQAAGDLRTNPLLLSLLCSLYSSVHFIPRNKPEIYEKCAELLFETWDRSRGIETTRRYGAHIKPAIQRLAWLILTDQRGRQAIPRSEIVEFLSEYMQAKRFEDADEAAQAADDFLDFCAGRAWVLTDMGSDALQPHYGFVHRTFLEYFAATQLVKTDPLPESVWERVGSRIGDPSWEVVAQLVMQLVDRQVEDGADRLLRLLLTDVDEPATSEPNKALLLAFAARSLDVVSPDNLTLRALVARCAEFSCSVPASKRFISIIDAMTLLNPDNIAGYSTFLVEDVPLAALTHVRSPDNVDRIAKSLAEVVTVLANESPQSPAGMVRAKLMQDSIRMRGSNGPSVEDHVARLLQERPAPKSENHWKRVMYAPSVEDLEERGLRTLFSSAVFLNRIPSPVFSSLCHELGSTSRANTERKRPPAAEYLDQIYDEVFARRRELLQMNARTSGPFAEHALELKVSDLEKLPSRGKACLLLLFLPVTSSGARGGPDPSVIQLLEARRIPYRRSDAIGVINTLALPAEAHAFMVRWVQGESVEALTA